MAGGDDDPLSWVMELDAKLDGAKAFLSQLEQNEEGLKRLQGQLAGAGKADESHAEKQEKHAKQAKMLGHELDELNKKLKTLTAFQVFEFGFDKSIELAHELAEAVLDVGKEILDAAGKQERLEKSFALQLGEEKGKETLEYLEQLGKTTEFVGSETKAYGQDLLKAGFNAEKLPHALAAVADLAALSSDRIGGATAAIEALSRIQRTGKVMERSLAPFGIGEDKLIKTLQSRGLHESTEAIKNGLEQGSINREAVLQAVYQTITDKTGKLLGGAGEEMGKNLEARLRRVKDLPELYFEKWADSPSFQVFSDRIDYLFQRLDPNSVDGQKIFKALEGALDSLTEATERFLTPEGIDGFISGIKGAIATIDTLIKGIQATIDLLNGETISKALYGGKNAGDKELNEQNEIAKGKYEAIQRAGGAGKNPILDDALKAQFANLGPAQLEDLLKAGKAQGVDYSAFMPKKEAPDQHFEGPAPPSWDSDPLDLPHFAGGGIVTKPTLAIVGESGPEAIVPLSGMSDAPITPGGGGGSAMPLGGGGRSVTIPISLYVTVEETSGNGADALAQRIREEIVPSALQAALEQLRAELGG